MTSTSSCALLRQAALALLPLACLAQISGPLRVARPAPILVRAGAESAATIKVQLDNGYHVNTNTPSDDYLIPLRLTWDAAPLEVAAIEYPKGQLERYQFSAKPLSVYTGDFAVVTKFRALQGAPAGSRKITGKLRYQACTETICYPPKTITFELPVDIR